MMIFDYYYHDLESIFNYNRHKSKIICTTKNMQDHTQRKSVKVDSKNGVFKTLYAL